MAELTAREQRVKRAAENEGVRLADAAIADGDWSVDGAVTGEVVEVAKRLADDGVPHTLGWSIAGAVFFALGVAFIFIFPEIGWPAIVVGVALITVWIVLTLRREKAVPILYEKAYYWGMAAARARIDGRLADITAQARAHREAHLAARRAAAEAAGIAVGDLSGPDPQPFGVSPEGAERLVAQWMRSLGDVAAEVTRYTSDGGIDVASEDYIAQVKHYTSPVGVGDVRQLAGVASTDHRQALFFTSTGYAPGAIEFADRASVALFVYSAEEGTLRPVNGLAAQFYATGL